MVSYTSLGIFNSFNGSRLSHKLSSVRRPPEYDVLSVTACLSQRWRKAMQNSTKGRRKDERGERRSNKVKKTSHLDIPFTLQWDQSLTPLENTGE